MGRLTPQELHLERREIENLLELLIDHSLLASQPVTVPNADRLRHCINHVPTQQSHGDISVSPSGKL